MTEYKFWMVWREHASAPTKKHTSLYEANQESIRLLSLSPSSKYYVLESVGSYHQAPHPFVWTPTDETRPMAERECNRPLYPKPAGE